MSTLIEQDGKWYKRVSMEQAWSIRKDIQLYIRHRTHSYIYKEASPDVYRAASPLVRMPLYWKDPNHDWFVEVEPTKEEYTPDG